ncbi:MAG: hypothetical protein QM820_64975 [Minicystis sp.]
MRWTGSLLSVVGICFALSCGARSNLQPEAAGSAGAGGVAGGGPTSSTTSSVSNSSSSGAGGSPTTSASTTSSSTTTASSTSSSGTGGTGGGPVVSCVAVKVADPILTVDQPSGDLTQPSLVTLDTAPETAAVVFSKHAVPPLMGPTVQVAAFAGWGGWPPAAPAIADMKDPTTPNGLVSGVSMVAASQIGSPPSFALLYRDFAGVQTSIAWDATADGTLGSHAATEGGQALMLVPSAAGDRILGGVSAPNAGKFALDMMVQVPNAVLNFTHIGCATTPVAADAAPAKTGWILAAALGTKFGWDGNSLDCTDKFSDIGPATKLSFASVDPSGFPATLTAVLDTAPVTRVRLAGRSDGAWALWSTEGSDVLEGVRLSTLPAPVDSFQIFAQTGTLVVTSFDVESIADALVLAAAVRMDGQNDGIQVAALGPGGQNPVGDSGRDRRDGRRSDQPARGARRRLAARRLVRAAPGRVDPPGAHRADRVPPRPVSGSGGQVVGETPRESWAAPAASCIERRASWCTT